MMPKTLELRFEFRAAEFNTTTVKEVALSGLFGELSIATPPTISDTSNNSVRHSTVVTGTDQRVWQIEVSANELAAAGNSRDSQPPLGDHDRICTRIVPKLIAAHGSETKDWYRKLANAKVLILGNLSTLRDKLESWGAVVTNFAGWSSADELLQSFASARDNMGSFDHVIVAPSFFSHVGNSGAAPANCVSSLLDFDFDRDILAIYRLAQEWFSGLGDALSPSERSFIVVTKMGGDLGLSGLSPAPR